MALTPSLLSERSVALLPQGVQQPRICHVPEFATSAGDEAIALSRLAGLEPDEWQQLVIRSALGERPDGKWAAKTVGLTVPRQNGKGSVLEIRELVGLFLLGEKLINHTAHQQKTATSHFKRLLELIEGVPEFEQRVLSAPKGKGNEAIELRGGQTIFFATRSGGGGRGLSIDLQVYDEAMYLTAQDQSSLQPTMSARSMHGNTQTWYVGSAVDEHDPAQDGVPFAKVREQGIARSNGVAYFEFSAPGDDPGEVSDEIASDPAIWAMANPALGKRISHEWVEHERSVGMGARGFAVERLGIGAWPVTDGSSGSKISGSAWAACADTESSCSDPVQLVFDVTPNRSSSTIGVAGLRPDGQVHIEIIEDRPGTGWVPARLAELVNAHESMPPLYDERGPAASLAPDIEAREVELRPVKSSELAQACGMFFDAVEQRTVHHLGTPELAQAIRGAATRPLGDAWAWARKSSGSNIAPLVAVTLAHWGVRTMMPDSEPLIAFI